MLRSCTHEAAGQPGDSLKLSGLRRRVLYVSYDRPGAVLITGAASGIGRACVLHLASKGWKVFAGVRDGCHVSSFDSENVSPLVLDITSDEQVQSAVSFVQERVSDSQLRGLVNSAGICVTGPLEHISRDQMREQFEVNVIGHLAVIQAFLPLLRRSRGRIVNIGSISGHISGAYFGPYCASKFALEAMTIALRAETRPSGVSVSIVDPGTVATGLWTKALLIQDQVVGRLPEPDRSPYAASLAYRRAQMRRARDSGASPEATCKAVAHALTARIARDRYVIGVKTKVKMALAKCIPEIVWRLLVRIRANSYFIRY